MGAGIAGEVGYKQDLNFFIHFITFSSRSYQLKLMDNPLHHFSSPNP